MLAFHFNRPHEACYRSYRMNKEWLKTISFIVFFFLLLQAANVHAGINGIHIAIMILEDCGRGVEMHYFGTKGPGEKFLVFQNECTKNLFKTFYKANYHRKAKRTETTEQSSTQTTTAGQTAPQTTTSGQTVPQIDRNKRKAACRKCLGCTKNDCGECVNCLDKSKFGGPNKRRRRCIQRVCARS